MQDVLLEPYGAEVLRLGVGATTRLTALLATGTLAAFAVAARLLARGADPYRLAATGALLGLPAFAAVIFAAPVSSLELFCAGAALIGFGSGLFSVGMLMAVMAREAGGQTGLALGAWGAVQATAAGAAIALGGTLRDLVAGLAARGTLGPAFSAPSVSYSIVYAVEIVLLFLALVAVGPLVRRRNTHASAPVSRFGLAEFPG
jgi:BCD family chlorophyll transporter-like MFS transporter